METRRHQLVVQLARQRQRGCLLVAAAYAVAGIAPAVAGVEDDGGNLPAREPLRKDQWLHRPGQIQ